MAIIETTTLDEQQKEQLLRLWNNEYPALINYKNAVNFEQYLTALIHKTHYLLLNESNIITGWLFVFIRDNEDWFALLLDSEIQSKGYGTQLLNKAKENFPALSGWAIDHSNYLKINGGNYISPVGFYIKNNFAVHPTQKFPSDKLSAIKIKWYKQN